MKDCRNREVHEDDVVLFTYKKSGILCIGTLLDGKIRTKDTIERAASTSSYTIYLLEQPTQLEIAEKNEIVSLYKKRKEEQNRKKKEKKNYGTMVGGIYSVTRGGQLYVYLGNLDITDYNEKGEVIHHYVEHCYKRCGHRSWPQTQKFSIELTFEQYYRSFEILKGYKTIDGLYGTEEKLKKYGSIALIGTYETKTYDGSIKGKRVVKLNEQD